MGGVCGVCNGGKLFQLPPKKALGNGSLQHMSRAELLFQIKFTVYGGKQSFCDC